MGYSDDQLNDIYDKTEGLCNICGRKLAFFNYGRFGSRGAWEIDYRRSGEEGGINYISSLFPACISCNRSKGGLGTRQASCWYE